MCLLLKSAKPNPQNKRPSFPAYSSGPTNRWSSPIFPPSARVSVVPKHCENTYSSFSVYSTEDCHFVLFDLWHCVWIALPQRLLPYCRLPIDLDQLRRSDGGRGEDLVQRERCPFGHREGLQQTLEHSEAGETSIVTSRGSCCCCFVDSPSRAQSLGAPV